MARAKEQARAAPRVPELDWLMFAVLCLACLGLVMAVSVRGSGQGGALVALEGQSLRLLAGLGAFLVCATVPIDLLRRHAWTLFGGALVLVLATLVIGSDSHGASRWLRYGAAGFQPVEPARLALILVTAVQIAAAGSRIGTLREGFAAVLLPGLALAGLLALQPDLGNALMSISIVVAMAVVAGVRLRWFAAFGLPLLFGAAVFVGSKGYAMERITRFLSDEPPMQVRNSILAISSGGVGGQGLGSGWWKMGFVPEAQNDFVFAIIGEEFGLLGTLFVLGLYGLIGYVGLRLVLQIRDPFHRYVVMGGILALCIQALINMLVTTGMAPAKGIDLPLVSSGGTNLMASLAVVGLIGNATRADRKTWR